METLYNYDYQFRLIVVGDSTVGKVVEKEMLIGSIVFDVLVDFVTYVL